jgi:hypothetical protein
MQAADGTVKYTCRSCCFLGPQHWPKKVRILKF